MATGMKRALASLVLLLAAAAGCKDYKYFDMKVSFDAATGFDSVSIFRVQRCRVTISGADSDTFLLPAGRCPNMVDKTNPFDAGAFEFSSFATGGTMTFTVDAYTDSNETMACKTGEGVTAVPVNSMMTIMSSVLIKMVGPGCSGAGPVSPDGG
jgi:hypothetical protein